MDPTSFAIGIVGLAGLFTTCLDILDKFDSWKECENESQALMAQFEAHKIRLEAWGQSVGIKDGTLSTQHDRLLDDPRVSGTVNKLLSAIKYICGPDDPSPVHELKRQKLKWALRTKMKRTEQVKQFSSVVQILYSLVPINRDAISHNDESLGRHGVLPEIARRFNRKLSVVVGLIKSREHGESEQLDRRI